MPTLTTASGVTLEAPASFQIRDVGALRLTAAFAAAGQSPAQTALARGLALAGFTVAAELEIRRAPGATALALGAATSSPHIDVAVAPGEAAVVLVESPGGVYAWMTPSSKPAPAAALAATGGSVLRFDLGAQPATPVLGFSLPNLRGPVLDWILNRIVDPVRTYVLKFVVTGVIQAAVDRIEGDLAVGLTNLSDPDPAHWTARDPSASVKPGNAKGRILLMVHGTFSTTMGSFGALAHQAPGQKFLQDARGAYDAVLGCDHKTLADTPEKNAADMLAALKDVPDGTLIDAVAYSRGGLVYRAFAEQLLPQTPGRFKLGKAVFVACTNRGTHLANPDSWEAMVDLYTNALMLGAHVITGLAGVAAANPFVDFGIQTIGRFVQMLSQVAINDRKVPGLAAMQPSSPLVTALDSAPLAGRQLADYFAITSNFVANLDLSQGITQELRDMVLDKVTNRLFQGPNDLVVDTTSMTDLGQVESLLGVPDIFAFGDVSNVCHTTYFANTDTAGHLARWIL
jgi:hypothetical protein